MTSMNSVLMKFFNLPPALRMVLAVAGFGSLATIVYFLLPALRTKQGRIWLLIIAGIGLVVFLLIYLVVRSVRRKQSKKLSGALESQGPTRGDIAEQEQIYRGKFHGKLTELRASGLSVYRLPWFVLIGEPGCGKTASLIHSGLDFPLGKDEVPGFGGTRNYNWWFTNDAVILDTAGRIAFQEEGTTDKVEWEYFLKLLKHNRPRCPVNGLIVALPADKLLRDNAEERAQKATVLRERLRQVHQTLGVRFPTFVLVTKMDLVGGFAEFFEEIRVELQQRNQMFGWSRPGEFAESFDPTGFPDTFDEVYGRLRDWSMRYLQRKATEQELGLIVTFPEAFRELREPLHDYVSTIFQKSPLLEPPFFRGFYFTSAVQEGAPIFDVFARTCPGVTVPERPARAVDSKAFFIHDLYERKVFAEKGLVFRSAKHVTVNKRMRRLVWAGSAAMLVVMLALFTFGYFGVSDLVTQPRQDCGRAATVIEAGRAAEISYQELGENLELAQRLQQHYQAYDRPWAGLRAHSLFIFANIAQPRDYVKLIHARFVLDAILRPIIRETETRLGSIEELGRAPDRYVAALEVYTRWYGEVVGQARRTPLSVDEARERGGELDALLAFLGTVDENRTAAREQVQAALESLSAQQRYFARQILRQTVGFEADRSTPIIETAVQRLTDRWMPLTRLGDPKDEFLRYWSTLASHLGELRARYEQALGLAAGFGRSEGYQETATEFMDLTEGAEYLGKATTPPEPETIARAYFDLRTFLGEDRVPQTDTKRIKRFAAQRSLIEQQWGAEFGPLAAALRIGAPNEDEVPQRAVYAALAAAQDKLRQSYDHSLTRLRERLKVPANAEPVDYYATELKLLKAIEQEESLPTFDEAEAALELVDHPFGSHDELITYLTDLRQVVDLAVAGAKLGDLSTWPGLLAGSGAALPTPEVLQTWFERVQSVAGRPSEEDIRQHSGLLNRPFWQPVELYQLAEAVWSGHQQRTVGAVLAGMQAQCTAVTQEPTLPGLGRLMSGFDQRVDTLPFESYVTPEHATAEPTPTEPEKAEQVEPPEEEEDWRRPHRAPPPEQPEQPEEEAERPSLGGPLPPLVAYHTRGFLHDTLKAYYDVREALGAHGERGSAVITALDGAADAYVDRYFLDWNDVYDDYRVLLDPTTLRFLEKCRAGAYDWAAFHDELGRVGNEMSGEFGLRVEALVREAVLSTNVFEADGRGTALAQLVRGRLRKLGPQRDLQERLWDVGRTAVELERRHGDAVATLSGKFTSAWRDYLRQVEKVGADPKNATAPPDRAGLRDAYEELIQWSRTEPEEVHFIAPLLDIAGYGEILLRHQLDKQVAGLFSPYAGRYPHVADARDTDAAFQRLSSAAQQATDPAKLVELLRATDRFERDYGGLFAALHTDEADPYRRVLEQSAAWVEFLYGDEVDRLQQELPGPLSLKWAIAKHEGTTSAGNFYDKVTVTLPLLKKGGYEPVGAVEEEARSGLRGSLPPNAVAALAEKDYEYRWSLFKRSGLDYAPPSVRVWGKNPQVDGPEAVTTPWQLPGSPWSLLLLVGADPANRLSGGEWIIPVLMKVGRETIGFDVAIEFERPFPGPIAPLAAPGSPPPMQAAGKYFSGG